MKAIRRSIMMAGLAAVFGVLLVVLLLLSNAGPAAAQSCTTDFQCGPSAGGYNVCLGDTLIMRRRIACRRPMPGAGDRPHELRRAAAADRAREMSTSAAATVATRCRAVARKAAAIRRRASSRARARPNADHLDGHLLCRRLHAHGAALQGRLHVLGRAALHGGADAAPQRPVRALQLPTAAKAAAARAAAIREANRLAAPRVAEPFDPARRACRRTTLAVESPQRTKRKKRAVTMRRPSSWRGSIS